MTNETLETIKSRRSCRAYKPEQITDEELNAVLEAGTYAASAMGRQSAKIVVVQDPAARAPESVLGKSTSACLQNGFVLGTASLLDGLADRFCAELGAQTAFYATGDLPRSIREACRTPIHYRETLIPDGLHRIWRRNRKG